MGFLRTAQLASASVPTLSGLESLAAAAGAGGGGGGLADASGGKKGKKFFKSLGFGSSKQEETNDFTHMRCGGHCCVLYFMFCCVFLLWLYDMLFFS